MPDVRNGFAGFLVHVTDACGYVLNKVTQGGGRVWLALKGHHFQPLYAISQTREPLRVYTYLQPRMFAVSGGGGVSAACHNLGITFPPNSDTSPVLGLLE